MENNIVKKSYAVQGMTCSNCELRIESAIKKLDGILEVKAVFGQSKLYVTYDEKLIGYEKIKETVEKAGYTMGAPLKAGLQGKEGKESINQMVGLGIILLALYVIVKHTIGFNFIPEINQSMGYGVLFIVGLLTSLHCIAMCGGINLSQCVAYKHFDNTAAGRMKPSLLYNGGRVLSYTVIGGIAGGIGSVVSFSGGAKGVVAIVAGIFMVIMGLNMLNIFPWLRRLNPRMPKVFGKLIYQNSGKNGPFYIGLLNGLMPCGPLQAMQLYALGTGSITAGALSMLMFSLGTVPLMFGFGAISSMLSKNFTGKLMKVSAALVIILGIVMMSRGLSLSGIAVSAANAAPGKTVSGNAAKIENGVQVVSIDLESNRYAPIVVQKGIPVKFIINAKAENINGCNNAIIIPEYNIEKPLSPGENVIEFTPTKEGTIPYSCWMGMIRSKITVVTDLSQSSETGNQQSSQDALPAAGGSCHSSGQGVLQTNPGNLAASDIAVAKIENGKQEVTITVNDAGFSPAVVVLQKGIKAKIKFNPEKLTTCNYAVSFPEYQGSLDLSKGELETPELNVTQDFTFQCWMGMLNGYVKVVDDINNIDLEAIKQEVQANVPAAGSGGGSCCN